MNAKRQAASNPFDAHLPEGLGRNDTRRGITLVPAGVVLRGDQHQPRAADDGFWLPRAAERGQNAEHYRISGENTESN
jgi:hypothetical protein